MAPLAPDTHIIIIAEYVQVGKVLLLPGQLCHIQYIGVSLKLQLAYNDI